MRQRIPSLKPAALDEHNEKVVAGWNLMGGDIEWAALDAVAAMVGVEDVELFVRGLLQIRTYQQKVNEARR